MLDQLKEFISDDEYNQLSNKILTIKQLIQHELDNNISDTIDETVAEKSLKLLAKPFVFLNHLGQSLINLFMSFRSNDEEENQLKDDFMMEVNDLIL